MIWTEVEPPIVRSAKLRCSFHATSRYSLFGMVVNLTQHVTAPFHAIEISTYVALIPDLQSGALFGRLAVVLYRESLAGVLSRWSSRPWIVGSP
jgi:hypothetical protein